MSENLQTLLRMAFLNNSYDYDSMDLAINKTWMNSYSYLYGLQKSHVDYEELFYYSGETISRNAKKIGNLYLDKLLYANFDVDYDMIHVYNREEFRRSEFYNKFYSFKDLVNNPKIFNKMPIILIDDMAIWDYQIFSSKDSTTIKLPFKRQFVFYDERNNVLFGKYNTTTHEFDLDVGQEYHGRVKDTNILYVEVTEKPDGTKYKTAYIWTGEAYVIYKEDFKDWDEVIYKDHKIQVLIVDNIFYERITTNKNAIGLSKINNTITIPKSLLHERFSSDLGTMFCSIHYPNSALRGYELGSMIIPLDDNGNSYIGRLSADITNKLNSTNINIYMSFAFIQNLHAHDFYFGGNTMTMDAKSHLMVIEKETLVPYECPIAPENFIIFREKYNKEGYQIIKNNTVVNIHYPNIYSFNTETLEVGDRIRVYYFYKEELDLKYTVLFDFYFRFLMLTFNTYRSFEEIVDRIYRNEISHRYNQDQLNSFKEVFASILDYQYYNHQYNESDFLYRYLPYGDNYDKEPIEYKDETLKSWIKVEPHVLRDYVLEQKKLGETYHLFTNTLDLSTRLRYDTSVEFDGHIHKEFPDGCYVFAMQNKRDYPELLDVRVFVDGIFVQDMYQIRKLWLDYIYVPVKYVTDDSYIELEVFPSYTYRTELSFGNMKEFKHVVIDKPEEKIWPTVSDIYFTSSERPYVRYDSAFFDIVEHYKSGVDLNIYRLKSNPQFYYRRTEYEDMPTDDGPISISIYRLFDFHDNLVVTDSIVDDSSGLEYYLDPDKQRLIINSYNIVDVGDTKEHLRLSNVDIHNNDLILSLFDIVDAETTKTYDGILELIKKEELVHDILPMKDRGSYTVETTDSNYPVRFTRLDTFDVRPNSPDILNIPMTLNITKNSMRIIVKIVGDGLYPYFKLTHTDFNFSQDYIRIFRNGRLVPKCKYQFNKLYAEPTLMLLDYYEPGEEIMLDISPYRYTEVYYKEELDPHNTIIDLRDYITKPFDVRYYEVYMNGRKLSINNVFAISPYQITLVNLKSIYNLEIFERERDWEYFGTDYKEHLYYYNIEDLFNSNFITEDVKNRLIVDIINRDKDRRLNIYPNTNEEEKMDYTDIRKFVQMYNFYHSELIPKTYDNPNRLQESNDIMTNIYNLVDEAFRRKPYLESKSEEEVRRRMSYTHALLLDPDNVISDGNPNNLYYVFPVGHLEDRVPDKYLAQTPEFIVEPDIDKR